MPPTTHAHMRYSSSLVHAFQVSNDHRLVGVFWFSGLKSTGLGMCVSASRGILMLEDLEVGIDVESCG